MNITSKVINRFHKYVVPEPMTGCHLWIGSENGNGYGTLHIDDKNEKSHRVSWEIFNGEIPKGILVCHKCDVRACVNPGHLFLGTHLDNNGDRERKGRSISFNGSKTHCKRGHEFTEENSIKTKFGKKCRECQGIHNSMRDRRKVI